MNEVAYPVGRGGGEVGFAILAEKRTGRVIRDPGAKLCPEAEIFLRKSQVVGGNDGGEVGAQSGLLHFQVEGFAVGIGDQVDTLALLFQEQKEFDHKGMDRYQMIDLPLEPGGIE